MKSNLKNTFIISMVFTLFAKCCYAQPCIEVGGMNGLAANTPISCVCSSPNGKIYASGGFTNSNNHTYVAVWDGTTWSELGGPDNLKAIGSIVSISSDVNNNIYAAGGFHTQSGISFVARWDSQLNTWAAVGNNTISNLYSAVWTMCLDNLGSIYVGGSFVDSVKRFCVAKYDPVSDTWFDVGNSDTLSTLASISTLCSDSNNNIYATGLIRNSNGKFYVAKWNVQSNSWSELGGTNISQFNYEIKSITSDHNTNLYAAGLFANGFNLLYVAKFDPITNLWTELGGPNSLNVNDFFTTICTDPDGNVYAAGLFDHLGAPYVVKWNALTNTWTGLADVNCQSGVYDIGTICSDYSGNIYVAGDLQNSNSEYFVGEYELGTDVNSLNFPKTELQIFPNPTKDLLNINLSDNQFYVVRILNNQNKIIYSESKNNFGSLEISVTNLAAGSYHLEMIASNGIVYHRSFVKMQ